MRLKKGVIVTRITPELSLALSVCDTVYREQGYDLVVTSVNDGKHSSKSLHYSGCAADIRTRDLEDPDFIVSKINQALGDNPDFDIVLEKDHIHIEWQPKYRSAQ